MAEMLRSVELLAPAGNMECLHAAVTGGADAVYLGLDEFNARSHRFSSRHYVGHEHGPSLELHADFAHAAHETLVDDVEGSLARVNQLLAELLGLPAVTIKYRLCQLFNRCHVRPPS